MKREFRKRRGLFFLIFLPFIFLLIWVVMLLWNAILPSVLHVTTVTYWQAAGILLLSKILFGGFHGRGRWHGMKQRRMEEKWQNMSPEEKEQFKNEWRERCGRWGRQNKESSAAGEEKNV